MMIRLKRYSTVRGNIFWLVIKGWKFINKNVIIFTKKIKLEEMNWHFLREDLQMSNVYAKSALYTKHQRNCNQNQNEISPHTNETGTHKAGPTFNAGVDVE